MKLFFLLTAAVLASASCAKEQSSSQTAIPPADNIRAVSLSPSITRQIIDLGAEDILIGVTTYSPPMKKKAAIVGSLVNPSVEAIVSLKPDMVFVSDEDAAVQKTDSIERTGLRIVRFRTNSGFRTISENYLRLGKILRRTAQAEKRISYCEDFLAEHAPENVKGERIAFFISTSPLIPAAGTSFVGDIIRMSGGVNVFEGLRMPYPVVSAEELIKRDPGVVVVMADSADRENFIKKFSVLKAVKNSKIYYVDADPFAFYTPSDYVRSVKILSQLLKNK